MLETLGVNVSNIGLVAKTKWYRTGIQPTGRIGVHTDPNYIYPLVHYKEEEKLMNEKGKAFQQYCYVCQLYGNNLNTQWACKECSMPLCNIAQ